MDEKTNKQASEAKESIEEKTLKFQVYQFAAKDFAANFFSLRSIEWKVIFEALAGYFGIGSAFYALQQHYSVNCEGLLIGGIIVTLILAGSTCVLSILLQRRLHRSRKLQNVYLRKAVELIEEELEIYKPEYRLKYERWYAFGIQMIINFTLAISLIAFMLLLHFAN
jgi:hypothetical protein